MIIAILEDDDRRRAAMTQCLRGALSQAAPSFFDSAHAMVSWLNEHQGDVSLISLDFDLPIRRDEDGKLIDYGTGRVVADFLALRPVTCPIIIHSSNEAGALQMMTALKEAGWPVIRVYPADDTAWIEAVWIGEICAAWK